jgi:hypothetical protein
MHGLTEAKVHLGIASAPAPVPRCAGGVEGDSAAEAYGREVWAACDALTAGLSAELAEQLRLLLEPTLASRLGGEYRTGKRINMKRVIAFIASHFRKDKIWMRRTRPDKRKYQVRAVPCCLGSLALQSLGWGLSRRAWCSAMLYCSKCSAARKPKALWFV